jgi:Domain of unknown function (DUF4062)
MQTVPKVFICSCLNELRVERERAFDAVTRLAFKSNRMEDFDARTSAPIETCLAEVRASDVLVVIVGTSYGSTVPNLGWSFSQAEYEEGFKLKKACFIYAKLKNEGNPSQDLSGSKTSALMLKRWKRDLDRRHTVCPFKNGFDLAGKVARSLARWHADALEKEAVNKQEEAQRIRTLARDFAASFAQLDPGLTTGLPPKAAQHVGYSVYINSPVDKNTPDYVDKTIPAKRSFERAESWTFDNCGGLPLGTEKF